MSKLMDLSDCMFPSVVSVLVTFSFLAKFWSISLRMTCFEFSHFQTSHVFALRTDGCAKILKKYVIAVSSRRKTIYSPLLCLQLVGILYHGWCQSLYLFWTDQKFRLSINLLFPSLSTLSTRFWSLIRWFLSNSELKLNLQIFVPDGRISSWELHAVLLASCHTYSGNLDPARCESPEY